MCIIVNSNRSTKVLIRMNILRFTGDYSWRDDRGKKNAGKHVAFGEGGGGRKVRNVYIYSTIVASGTDYTRDSFRVFLGFFLQRFRIIDSYPRKFSFVR